MNHRLNLKQVSVGVLVLLAFASTSFADENCVGPAGAPVKMIFLHGFHDGDTYPKNIEQMKKLAFQQGIRIAMPKSRAGNDAHWEYWKGKSNTAQVLKQIETDAAKVCGSPLAVPRKLYGFSNGSYMAQSIAHLSCGLIENYDKIVSIGGPGGSQAQGCGGKHLNLIPHVIPNNNTLASELGLSGQMVTRKSSGQQ